MKNARGECKPTGNVAVRILIVLDTRDAASWQMQLVDRLCASGLCETFTADVGMADVRRAGPPGGPAEFPGARRFTAIVDLTGRLDARQHDEPAEGVWRLCDGRGVVLGDRLHGLETVAAGVGIQLHLVACTRGTTTLVDSAAAYAEPGARVSLERLCGYARALLLSAVREVAVLGALDRRRAWKPDGSYPTPMSRLIWKARGVGNRILKLLRGALVVEQWMVGVIDMRFTEALRSQHLPIRWIGKRDSSHCWADPFGVPGCQDEIYCEEFDFRKNIGRIVKLKLNEGVVPERSQDVELGLQGHLSYPYLFRHAGALYCVAESGQSRRCVLNRLDECGRWKQVVELVDNIEVADPTIFRHGGYFWLAYTDVSMGAFDNLCLCYATDLLGPWHAHPQNPVKFDHGSSRSAGSVIKDGDQLLRVAQVCKSRYGQAVAVNRILHCTPEFYREEVTQIIGPGRDRTNPHGLHTMSEWGDRVLVDGKRNVINHWVVWRRIATRVARVYRKSALFKARAGARAQG
ncbi:glycoside hydrolase family 43 protein [Cupriavidus oxalaticus]|uniref:Glucosamine inositolphosphorylceramide transferase 1 N-terminal domain-containing protein n=1 Tax=Cupriavidus oxalaticus TaxID=96344 RepID=A0A5P3VFD4_9BURK|nr:glycoside hydrolase family 43 protein [Cupriavidus oxalaticus]QEZ44082.1 hypothetical protein D2917_07425 [Cupriavidus oxalaticus]